MSLKLLLDTNVWLDYFLDRSARHDEAGELVVLASQQGAILLTALHTVKDVYFLIASELKRMQRESAGKVAEDFASAVNETAWACITSIRKQSTIVGGDLQDMLEATVMRPLHPDFEDNLVIAAALRAQADYLVSSDARLLKHAAGHVIGMEHAIELLRAG